MTDLPHTDDSDGRPDPEEAAEIIRQDPVLGAESGDAMTDDDARTPDTAPVGETQGG
ncbi:MAG TPA: hypothetical protein VF657_04655 [Actinoplanes sp.]|jgi:hypothetical protein